MSDLKWEFRKGPDFAEMAEALGISTDAIAAATGQQAYSVLHGYEFESFSILIRGLDGIMQVLKTVDTTPELRDSLLDTIRRIGEEEHGSS